MSMFLRAPQIGGALPRCREGVLLAERLFLGHIREGQSGGQERSLPSPHQALETSGG